MSDNLPQNDEDYIPDRRLSFTYDEANKLDEAGLEALCPSYIELSEVAIRYQDDELLGKGAVKDVYRTYDNRSKRWVAMARLRENRGPEFYDLFVHEAWLTSSLSHPNIIKIYDVGVDEQGKPYFTMDMKGNTSLADLLGEDNNPGRQELLNIFTKVCDAVAYAHSRGVIHLDLKPENIQTDDFGETLVCDWGLGKVVGELEENEDDIPVVLQSLDNMTLMGQIKGTPGYMAPEQVTPGATKDYHTDIFALGCILHTILTGSPPFLGSRATVIDATSRANIVPPRMRYPQKDVPESLEAVVMKATARAQHDRYHSAMDLKAEVFKYLRGYSTSAEHSGFFREARLFITRNRVPALITCIAILGITIISVLFFQRIERQVNATNKEKDRGSIIASKADAIQSDYDYFQEQSEQSRKELASRLATSSKTLKNLGVFDQPKKSLEEARELGALALALDPENEKARFQVFSLDCIALNFKKALSNVPPKDSLYADYTAFAEANPDFSYGAKYRPSCADLARFYRNAQKINPNRGPLMERIHSYDYSCRQDFRAYGDVVAALIEYMNGGNERLICRFNPQNREFFLWSAQAIRLRLKTGTGSGKCMLRYLPLNSLKLDVAGKLNLLDLQSLPIEQLDISQCAEVQFNQIVSLPQLRELRINARQNKPSLIKRIIQTSKELKITVVSNEK